MTCQDSFHEVAFNISFWTRNISSARILFWRGVCACIYVCVCVCFFFLKNTFFYVMITKISVEAEPPQNYFLGGLKPSSPHVVGAAGPYSVLTTFLLLSKIVTLQGEGKKRIFYLSINFSFEKLIQYQLILSYVVYICVIGYRIMQQNEAVF